MSQGFENGSGYRNNNPYGDSHRNDNPYWTEGRPSPTMPGKQLDRGIVPQRGDDRQNEVYQSHDSYYDRQQQPQPQPQYGGQGYSNYSDRGDGGAYSPRGSASNQGYNDNRSGGASNNKNFQYAFPQANEYRGDDNYDYNYNPQQQMSRPPHLTRMDSPGGGRSSQGWQGSGMPPMPSTPQRPPMPGGEGGMKRPSQSNMHPLSSAIPFPSQPSLQQPPLQQSPPPLPPLPSQQQRQEQGYPSGGGPGGQRPSYGYGMPPPAPTGGFPSGNVNGPRPSYGYGMSSGNPTGAFPSGNSNGPRPSYGYGMSSANPTGSFPSGGGSGGEGPRPSYGHGMPPPTPTGGFPSGNVNGPRPSYGYGMSSGNPLGATTTTAAGAAAAAIAKPPIGGGGGPQPSMLSSGRDNNKQSISEMQNYGSQKQQYQQGGAGAGAVGAGAGPGVGVGGYHLPQPQHQPMLPTQPLGVHGTLEWKEVKNLTIPSSALVAGKNNGEPVYIIKYTHKSGVYIGMLSKGIRGALVICNGSFVKPKEFSVLCGRSEMFNWYSAKGRMDPTKVTQRLVVGGRDSKGRTVFIGKRNKNGNIYVGSIGPGIKKGISYPYEGKEKLADDYQMLCFS